MQTTLQTSPRSCGPSPHAPCLQEALPGRPRPAPAFEAGLHLCPHAACFQLPSVHLTPLPSTAKCLCCERRPSSHAPTKSKLGPGSRWQPRQTSPRLCPLPSCVAARRALEAQTGSVKDHGRVKNQHPGVKQAHVSFTLHRPRSRLIACSARQFAGQRTGDESCYSPVRSGLLSVVGTGFKALNFAPGTEL